ncbi:Ubiquinone biosynthesis protein UbiJ [hydrothermal vent metagenome]|uniref:Ubiquinone biosynthesis protein UbiJ n=1 Tax=hydrothermal vent metagenome TaxID=652676 RepID=A0A3B0WJU3_9ZZZZ
MQPSNLMNMSLSQTIESILNTAIRLDDMQGDAFKALEDKVIAVTLTPMDSPLYFIVTDAMVSVQTTLQGEPDAAIQTTLVDFASLPFNRHLPHAKLSGNQTVAQDFITALCTLDIDWEEQLSHYTGDLIAFKVGHGIRSLLNTQTNINQTASQTVREYLQFELEAVPIRHQATRFYQEVNSITNEVNALEKRINQLSTPTKL